MSRFPPIDCGHTCPARWIHGCVMTMGHTGPHRDWTDRPWTDKDLERAEKFAARTRSDRKGEP